MALGIHSLNASPPQPPAPTSLPEPLRSWSGTTTGYPRGKTVAALFEEIAAQRSEAVAITSGGGHVSYAELNRRANRVAHHLRHLGVVPETMVGCCIPRSIQCIVALLGILKAGGAYVPLDPLYPRERFELIVRHTGMGLILTERPVAAGLQNVCGIQMLYIDDIENGAPSESVNCNPLATVGPTSLAYVMHTSGSTGHPKGVLVENRAIVRLVRNTNYCHFGPDEVFLHFAPISFDASTFEIWGALLNGGRLVVMPPQSSSLDALARAIREDGVTTLWLTAGLFELMVEQRLDDLRSLQQFLAGGDVLSPSHVRRFLERVPHARLINGYGPTENTTFTCCYTLPPGKPVPDSIPIGRPVANTQVYVLDTQMNPVSPGEAGELYAAGDGLARGYLNDPEGTAAKFVKDPFFAGTERRMYRTGDLVKWRDDGTIEFLGRIDDQVKILGFRIEPGEIEASLRACDGVNQVCVVPRRESNGVKHLVAYYVSSKASLEPEQLRQLAARKLPQQMIPAHFIRLDSLPLSSNGKTDRTALAQLQVASQHRSTPSESSQNDIESSLVQIWQKALNLPEVGLDDNFFDLGGDSLLLVAVHSDLQKTLRANIPVTDLFEFTTIRKLARHLGQGQPDSTGLALAQQRAKRQREALADLRTRRPGIGDL